VKVLGISGSLRQDSYNTSLLRTAAELLPQGVELVVFEDLAAIPPYSEDTDTTEAPAAVAALRRAVEEADGVLVVTPEYNGSIPGQLKNALDWVSRPFATNPLRNKPAAVMGASTGMFGAVWAQADLRKVLGLIGARVLDHDTPVGLAETRFAGGRLVDEEARESVADTLSALSEAISEREELAAAA
jgi:chromate reductase, NAD(P)H dehydrogenase (quinone)